MVVKIMGGLGNQLFIYAFGYALFKEKNCDNLLLDTVNYDIYDGPKFVLDYFNIEASTRFISANKILIESPILYKLYYHLKIRFRNIKIFKERELFLLEQDVFNQKDKTLFIGYWQNYRYFDKYRQDIVRQFRLKVVSDNLEDALLKLDNHCVAVHVRRGDYKTYRGGKCLSIDYYKHTMDVCYEKDNQVKFFIFSDDEEYCKVKFEKYNVVIVSEQHDFSDIEEFVFMSSFRRFIIANSTFSWWAAYISNSCDVYAPVVDMWRDQFYPPKWKRILAKIENI